MQMSSAPVTLTLQRAPCGIVNFYIGAIRSKADNIKILVIIAVFAVIAVFFSFDFSRVVFYLVNI